MKVRLRKNTIRFRLTQTEAAKLLTAGTVKDSTSFGPGDDQRLSYSIRADEHCERFAIGLSANEIAAAVPAAALNEWLMGPLIELAGEQSIGDGQTIEIRIEKDLSCLKPRPGTDDDDTFPNPLRSEKC